MSKASTERPAKRVTLNELHRELRRLRRRIEDLEDLRDLNEAIARNNSQPGVPWSQVKKELGI